MTEVKEQNMVDWLEGTGHHDDPKYCHLCDEQKGHPIQKWANSKNKAFRACNEHSEYLGRYYSFYRCGCGAFACSH